MPRATPVDGLEATTPLKDAGPRLLAARLEDVRGLLEGAAARDPDAVHDLRVACRRLRVALDLLGGGRLAPLEERVKELQDALGAVRDGQVQQPWLRSTHLPRLECELQARAAVAAAALDAALSRFARKTVPALRRSLHDAGGSGKLGGKRMRKELLRRLRRLDRALRDAASLHPGAAHRLRIAAKRVRYQTELLEPAFPEAAAELLERIEPLQDALGDLHDADARMPLLRRFLEAALDDELPAGLAALAQLQAERELRAAAARREMKRWRKKGLVKDAEARLAG